MDFVLNFAMCSIFTVAHLRLKHISISQNTNQFPKAHNSFPKHKSISRNTNQLPKTQINFSKHKSVSENTDQFQKTRDYLNVNEISGRKNVLRKLVRIPYRRFKASFSVCWLCLFVAGVLSEMHEVRAFAPCKAFLFEMFAFFRRLKITLDSEQPMLKEKRIIPSVWGGIKGFEYFLRGEHFSDCASD